MDSTKDELKLKQNLRRYKYLRLLSMICLLVDLLSYALFESIEFSFANNNSQIIIILSFIGRVKYFTITQS